MVSKTLARRRKRVQQEKAGEELQHVTAATRGHMAHGKLVRMRHGLKKKRKYRIGTATAYDVYENQDKPLGDVRCDSAKAALAEAARRRAAATTPTTAKTEPRGAVMSSEPSAAPKTKKVVKRVVTKKKTR